MFFFLVFGEPFQVFKDFMISQKSCVPERNLKRHRETKTLLFSYMFSLICSDTQVCKKLLLLQFRVALCGKLHAALFSQQVILEPRSTDLLVLCSKKYIQLIQNIFRVSTQLIVGLKTGFALALKCMSVGSAAEICLAVFFVQVGIPLARHAGKLKQAVRKNRLYVLRIIGEYLVRRSFAFFTADSMIAFELTYCTWKENASPT